MLGGGRFGLKVKWELEFFCFTCGTNPQICSCSGLQGTAQQPEPIRKNRLTSMEDQVEHYMTESKCRTESRYTAELDLGSAFGLIDGFLFQLTKPLAQFVQQWSNTSALSRMRKPAQPRWTSGSRSGSRVRGRPPGPGTALLRTRTPRAVRSP